MLALSQDWRRASLQLQEAQVKWRATSHALGVALNVSLATSIKKTRLIELGI